MAGAHGLKMQPVITRPQILTSGISGGWVSVPPGGVARAHRHRETDVIVVVTQGEALTLWGEELEHEVRQVEGQFLHIPAPAPHAVVNLSRRRPIHALEFRAHPEFDHDMHLLPHLYHIVMRRAEKIAQAG